MRLNMELYGMICEEGLWSKNLKRVRNLRKDERGMYPAPPPHTWEEVGVREALRGGHHHLHGGRGGAGGRGRG